MSQQEIIHAYRHLYRNALHAVQFHHRARGDARDMLRNSFREKHATFDAVGIQRTIWFLKAAAKERGLEHKILKNVLKTYHARRPRTNWKNHLTSIDHKKTPDQEAGAQVLSHVYDHYDMTIALLNKTMGLCLR